MTSFITVVTIGIAILLLSAFSLQGIFFSQVLRAYAQTANSTTSDNNSNSIAEATTSFDGNLSRSSNEGNFSVSQNASDGQQSLEEEDEEITDEGGQLAANDTTDGSALSQSNLTGIASNNPTVGTITITETGIDNSTGGSPQGLSVSVSGRYFYDPLTGVIVNQTIGQMVIEGRELPQQQFENDSDAGTSNSSEASMVLQSGNNVTSNAANMTGTSLSTTSFNLTNPIVAISEDFRNVTITSKIIGRTDGFADTIGNASALLTFEFPIDFTQNNQVLNTTAASGYNKIAITTDSTGYETSPATTNGQLLVFVDTFSTVKQELQTINATGQDIQERLTQENSTLPESIQDAVFQSLNVTIPTTTELQNATQVPELETQEGNQSSMVPPPIENVTQPVLESRIKPLLQNASEQQIQSLSGGQKQLFDFILSSLKDSDLTDGQNIQLNLLVQQLSNESAQEGPTLQSKVPEIVDGIGAILLGSFVANNNENTIATDSSPQADVNESFASATSEPAGMYFAVGAHAYPSLVDFRRDGITPSSIVPVVIGVDDAAVILLPVLVAWLTDFLKDRTPPTIISPPDITEIADSPCTYVNLYKYGSPYVKDDRDPSPTITNNAPPCFPIGITYVKWKATDSSGNSATEKQAVIIRSEFKKSFTITQSGIADIVNDNDGDGSDNGCSEIPITGVRASGDDGNEPSNTLDNSLRTRWSGHGIGSWIRLDMGERQAICNIEIAWYKGNIRSNDFAIAVSDDGRHFRTIYSDVSSGKTLSPEVYDIPDTIARYVKVTVYGNTINNWASITEIDVNGHDLSTAAVVSLKVSGSYEYNILDRKMVADTSNLEGVITIYDAHNGRIIERQDLAPIDLSSTQLNKKITVKAEVDSPVKSGTAVSTLNFDRPVDFRYGGLFKSTGEENSNILIADIDGVTYDTHETSAGEIHIEVPLACILSNDLQCPS